MTTNAKFVRVCRKYACVLVVLTTVFQSVCVRNERIVLVVVFCLGEGCTVLFRLEWERIEVARGCPFNSSVICLPSCSVEIADKSHDVTL